MNAFATEPLRGNPAVVCILHKTPSEQFMEQLAQEMNQPVTAFACRKADNE
ncbi:phenazine biosynthesis protein PhzF family protein [Bacillus methanolicus PB1]|uniref:Phenazine biosynthesis protein PhzF family protein n=1 Tax=Bacillus methanolicus PB1 TaxID=997296 RepID=I3E733_BACMT|nr:PhzF family phenazine biosynthesis protein [Bacillus methanolicus]EIJ82304.1 phenazine biosynthesis protein PhzF family protein [Bacillus methanolicus PB1]